MVCSLWSEARDGIQRVLDGLGRWAGVKLGEASGAKCMVLSVDQSNLSNGYWIGDD